MFKKKITLEEAIKLAERQLNVVHDSNKLKAKLLNTFRSGWLFDCENLMVDEGDGWFTCNGSIVMGIGPTFISKYGKVKTLGSGYFFFKFDLWLLRNFGITKAPRWYWRPIEDKIRWWYRGTFQRNKWYR